MNFATFVGFAIFILGIILYVGYCSFHRDDYNPYVPNVLHPMRIIAIVCLVLGTFLVFYYIT